jgi:hypothetical protein
MHFALVRSLVSVCLRYTDFQKLQMVVLYCISLSVIKAKHTACWFESKVLLEAATSTTAAAASVKHYRLLAA